MMRIKIFFAGIIFAITLVSCTMNKVDYNTNEPNISHQKNVFDGNSPNLVKDEYGGDEVILENDEHNSTINISSDNSFWYDGIEFKVLEYINDEKMLVKFMMGDYLIQSIVPRELEETKYISEYVTEYEKGDNLVFLKLTHPSQESAVYFSYIQGEEVYNSYPDRSLEGFKEEFDLEDDAYEYQTPDGRTGIIGKMYESDFVSHGYSAIVYDDLEKIMLVMLTLDDNEESLAKEPPYMEQTVFRGIEDSDTVNMCIYPKEEQKARIDSLYEKYKEIVYNTDEVLQTQYDAIGEEFQGHCLKDVNSDGIPEIVYLGNPGRVCVVGEENAISLPARGIYWTNDDNVFYTTYSFPGCYGYRKYEITTDISGKMSLTESENNYIEYDSEKGYFCNGEEITEEIFNDLEAEIISPKMPEFRYFDGDEVYAGKGSFYDCVKRLVDGEIY